MLYFELVVCPVEAALLTATPPAQFDPQRAAQQLRAAGAARVLVTLGAQGVLIADEHGSSLEPALPMPVVDTTGAGDTFVGCFAAAIAEGRDLTDAVREAQCAAALKVTRMGAQTAIPRRAEVEALRQRLPPSPATRS